VSDQLPPADRLAEVRQQLRTLTEQEAALKALMINDPSARSGNAYVVEICEVETRRCDLKELRAAYPAEVEEHTYPIKTTRVELRGISEDGEVIRIKRGKTA
jgi:hypothetical protein